MVAKIMRRQSMAATAFAFCLLLLPAPANAGLQEVMTILIKFGAYEQSDLPRAFVSAGEGNDAPLNISSGPELRYDPVSGNLAANLSARSWRPEIRAGNMPNSITSQVLHLLPTCRSGVRFPRNKWTSNGTGCCSMVVRLSGSRLEMDTQPSMARTSPILTPLVSDSDHMLLRP
jgi:hypothetical protein